MNEKHDDKKNKEEPRKRVKPVIQFFGAPNNFKPKKLDYDP